jgi:hypothetical protein
MFLLILTLSVVLGMLGYLHEIKVKWHCADDVKNIIEPTLAKSLYDSCVNKSDYNQYEKNISGLFSTSQR